MPVRHIPAVVTTVVLLVLLAARVPSAGPTAARAADEEPLTTAQAVARSDVSGAATPPAVRLEAVVTHRFSNGTIFLRDGTGSTFIVARESNPVVPRGERLRIDGSVHRGLFINGIRPTRIERLGPGPAPDPEPITPAGVAAGGSHYQWVSLEGVGRAWRRTGEETATLEVNVTGDIVEARFEHAPRNVAERPWVGARLLVRGIAAGEINDRRQLIRPYLLVPGEEDVAVLEAAPADPFALPATAFSALGQGDRRDTLQRVEGIAVAVTPDERLFLGDGERGLCVSLAVDPTIEPSRIRPGDRVEALGFVAPGPFATRLVEARARAMAPGVAVRPRRPSAAEWRAGCDAQLIEVEMQVREREGSGHDTVLLGDVGGIAVRVRAPADLPARIVPGATIRVTGPCLVTATTTSDFSLRAAAYELLPRTAGDVVLLRSPPWWNARRLAGALAASLAAGGAAVGWIVLLRQQVRRQVAVIEEKVQSAAVAEERRRIAREFHDSLEQDLAGLALRIDSAAGSVADPEARRFLERQREILARLQDETRQYVWDLREPSRLQGGLAERVRAMLAEVGELCDTPIEFSASGAMPALAPESNHHLLRMLREAVNNAAKHSSATRIAVSLAADAGGLVATVRDDGAGFDAAAAGGPAIGHFGLRGLTERARRIGAEATVDGRSGTGTVVTIRLPRAE
jgi:signal transduction histidine kinase